MLGRSIFTGNEDPWMKTLGGFEGMLKAGFARQNKQVEEINDQDNEMAGIRAGYNNLLDELSYGRVFLLDGVNTANDYLNIALDLNDTLPDTRYNLFMHKMQEQRDILNHRYAHFRDKITDLYDNLNLNPTITDFEKLRRLKTEFNHINESLNQYGNELKIWVNNHDLEVHRQNVNELDAKINKLIEETNKSTKEEIKRIKEADRKILFKKKLKPTQVKKRKVIQTQKRMLKNKVHAKQINQDILNEPNPNPPDVPVNNISSDEPPQQIPDIPEKQHSPPPEKIMSPSKKNIKSPTSDVVNYGYTLSNLHQS